MYNKGWEIWEILAGMCGTEPLGFWFFSSLGGWIKCPGLEAVADSRSREGSPAVVYFTKGSVGRSGDEVNSLRAIIGSH